MNRRAARWLAPILAALFSAITVLGGAGIATATTTTPEPPPVTANEFLPRERDLSDCVGALEKPGCGSEARGGAGQTAVFVLIMLGMALIFTRIVIGVRKNRSGMVDP